MKNRFKVFNIILFCAWVLLYVFELIKLCIWVSHRPLETTDISNIIVGGLERVLLFLVWFVFSIKYETNQKFKKTTIVFFSLCSLLCVGFIYSKAVTFSQLFLGNEYYTPPFIDKFTSLFELLYITIYSLCFISYFVVLICKKHFIKMEDDNE